MRHSEKGDSLISKLKELDSNPTNDPLKKEEQRDFGVGAQILRDLNVKKIKLITNHPRKRIGLTGYGLEIVETVGLYNGLKVFKYFREFSHESKSHPTRN